MDIETLNVPGPVKAALADRRDSITYSSYESKGANGHVVFGTNRISDKKVALKFYYWGGEQRFHAEPRLLASIRSPHVIEIEDALQVSNEWALFITPFYEGGDLERYLGRGVPPIRTGVQHCLDILDGLSALHDRDLVHRDIKPANILLNRRGRPLIADFGSVRTLPQGANSVPGSGHSPLYTPPESVDPGEYGQPGDIYQVGLVLYQLLGGRLPINEVEWLNQNQLRRYGDIADRIEQTLFADGVLRAQIRRGRVLDMKSLPAWVPKQYHRLIRAATHTDVLKRFASSAAFMGELVKTLEATPDWAVLHECPTLQKADRMVRVTDRGGRWIAEQDVGNGWRKIGALTWTETREEMINRVATQFGPKGG